MTDDRTKPPPGYTYDCHEGVPGQHYWMSDRWYDSEPDAIAAAWAHRDRIAAEALREAAADLQEQPNIDMLDVEDWLRARADALDPPKGTP